jgi:hypothetical protein
MKALPFLIAGCNVLYPPSPPPQWIEQAGILPDNSKEIGLTWDEYQILLEDIEQAIAWGNKTYGYGGAGYLAEDGNYYLAVPPPANQFIDHTLARRGSGRRKGGRKK